MRERVREERDEVIAKERERERLNTDLPEPVCILDALFSSFRPSVALGNFLKG